MTESNRDITLHLLISGHYLLTELLLERMVQTAMVTGIEGRIINVSSTIHSWVRRDGFQFIDMLYPKVYELLFLFPYGAIKWKLASRAN